MCPDFAIQSHTIESSIAQKFKTLFIPEYILWEYSICNTFFFFFFISQVSTWFANARRRLKKENKMTWEPKNKLDDEDVEVSDDDEKDPRDEDKQGEYSVFLFL